MKIIFLGLMFCEESLKRALETSKCGIQYAPHLFQKNLLEGLEKQDVELTVFNVPPMGSFLFHSKELFSKAYTWGETGRQIGFVNLPVCKHFEQRQKILRACRKILRSTDEPVAVVLYSPYEPFLHVCRCLKEEFNHVRCCMILTDPIPGKGDLARFMTASAVKKGEWIIAQSKCVDGFVVLTRYLLDSIEAEGRPHEVIECICNGNQKKSAVSQKSRNVALYCGALEEEYGILDMARAFSMIPDAEFRIYGKGGIEAELKRISRESPNIKFLGFAAQQVIEGERDACDFLINPRRPTGTFTKYSFPSKTAEYMTSGKPVIMYKLEGVPDAYDPYLNYLSATEPVAIAQELGQLFDEDYAQLTEKAERGRQFMLNEKSGSAQGQKVRKLLEALFKQ